MKWNCPWERAVNLAPLTDAFMASIVSQCGAGIAGALAAASAASPVEARAATKPSAKTFIIGLILRTTGIVGQSFGAARLLEGAAAQSGQNGSADPWPQLPRSWARKDWAGKQRRWRR